ncbi:hypothetical protein DFR29_103263 [Tahibacter aquaticus]|uniref:Uncharacterized protein n=1 Tax=Tahibacter aquaticus TaxID=520092 RepID=A0A4R6Z4V8_9GAMM|nr:hypothetical protein [Tahibacter aquaticus]TDR46727.1 hypothetical protein DFR29_103263 [Tahibacter aquaticus]
MSFNWTGTRAVAINQEPEIARETLLNILYEAMPQGHYRVRQMPTPRDEWPTFAIELDTGLYHGDLAPAATWRLIADALHEDQLCGLQCRII